MSQPEFGKKKINAAVNTITALAKETDVLVTGVQSLDESGTYNVPPDVLAKVADKVIQKAPGITMMILVAGETECLALVRVKPEFEVPSGEEETESSPQLTGEEWLEKTGLAVLPTDQQPASNSKQRYVCGVLKDVASTLKTKDELNSRAFGILREKKLFVDDESDDEMPDFDWQ